MSNESERLMFWIGHDARHVDRHVRSMAASLGAGQDIFWRHSGDCLSGTQGRTASAYRACAQAIWHRAHPTTASPAVLPPRTRPCWPKWLSVWHPGFHTNNGSESINYQVAGLLETLRVEFTTSRSRHSNDTAWRSPRTARACANIWALPKPATRRRSGQ